MKTKEQIAREIISLYRSKSQIKRMKETIKGIYHLDNKEFAEVEKTAKFMIDRYVDSRYDGAVSYAKDGHLALLDAFKRACKDRKFCDVSIHAPVRGATWACVFGGLWSW